MIDTKAYNLLEFDKIKLSVAECAASEISRNRIIASEPSFDKNEILRNLSLTQEADMMLNKFQLNPISTIDDVEETVEKALKDSTLTMGELLKIGKLLRSARIARTVIDSAPQEITLLKELTNGITTDKALEKNIFDCILSDTQMSDNASDKLYGLRKKILSLNYKLKEKLLSYTRNNSSSKYLQDNLVTVREGRYVLPVKSECRSEVQGLVHDKSATGSTVFIEPFAIVELNNELRFAVAEEQAEIERILYEFSKRVAMIADILKICQNICITLDIVFCKAKYSSKIRGVFPQFSSKKQYIKLLQARHPLIDKEKVIPVDIELGEKFSILIITGPNTGGKTVCLKTVGLFCLMAYFGLYLPCAEAQICLFDNILCDIGDEQSIENELSTFSSHVTSLISITNNMTENSLVLLDEVGGGTDPTEGAALAVGIVKYIETIGASAILTTHYGAVKEYAVNSRCAENACMQFDANTFSPTFRLIIGMPGTSNALKIAERLGLNDTILKYAYENINQDEIQFENILQNAEAIKNESLAELENTRKLKAAIELERTDLEQKRIQIDSTMERIKNNAAAETKRLVANAMERANKIIDEMKQSIKDADEAALLKARKLRNELDDISYRYGEERNSVVCAAIMPDEITYGKEVIVKSLNASGIIKSVNLKRKEAEVQVGAIKTKVPFDDLGKPVKENKVKKAVNSPVKSISAPIGTGFSEREIKVLGMTVSEAIEAIEPIIISMNAEDDAKILKVVHGKGTGALWKGLHAYFKSSPLVSEYRFGRYGEGDNGVTFVTVK